MAKRDTRDGIDMKSEQTRKLFIGGLSLDTDENGLRSFFEQWGELVDVVVMKDKSSGRSRGFGFVTYTDITNVDEAQRHRPHQIDNRTVQTKRAMPRDDPNPETHTTVERLFVGALKKDMTKDDLLGYFSEFGNVKEAEVITSKDTGESRGFGFVSFDDYDAVDRIILTKPHMINGNKIEVKKALSKEQVNSKSRQEPTRGFGRGGAQRGGMSGRDRPRDFADPYAPMGGFTADPYADMMGGGYGQPPMMDPMWAGDAYWNEISGSMGGYGGMSQRSGMGYDNFGAAGGQFGNNRSFGNGRGAGGPMRPGGRGGNNAGPYQHYGRGRR